MVVFSVFLAIKKLSKKTVLTCAPTQIAFAQDGLQRTSTFSLYTMQLVAMRSINNIVIPGQVILFR